LSSGPAGKRAFHGHVRFRTVDGIRVRHAESERRREHTLLLTSPWPESLYAFAPIWSALAKRAHLVAVELPGFGRSERRDDLLSPSAMGDFIARLIEEWGLVKPHIVGPDVGTSAVLFAAAARPDLMSSVVVGSGAAAVPLQLGEPLASWVLEPDLERFRATDPRALVGAAIDTIEAGVADDVRADYLESYDGDRFVESMRYVRSYPEELPELARRLAEIETPVQIIAGGRDPAVPLVNAEFLDERLSNSRLTVIDAGHFVWEEAPMEYASAVIDWIAGVVTVVRADNQAEAELLQGLLEAEGVPSYLRRTAGFDVPDFLAAGPRDVVVPVDVEQVARDVLLLSGRRKGRTPPP
jgi:pimeloyl-ACP methyl ester carboxylesterase